MPKPKKRKCDNGDGVELQRRSLLCMLHVSGIQHGDFTPLSNIKGSANDKLTQLHCIRDRRLLEPLDSPSRMEDVCSRIPDNLVDADLEEIGYHRGCYQNFTKNQDRLKSSSNETFTSRSHRKPSCSSATLLFPPECIFCNKLEVKVSGSTERCINFAVFKDKKGMLKEPTWKQIETRALELGDSSLYGRVQGEDLFAREAKYHQSCRKSFNLKYLNHQRYKDQGANRVTDSDQAAAQLMAFNAVLEFLQTRVIVQKEVVKLASLRLLYIQELEKHGFPNPKYRSEKLKAKLENHEIIERIAFTKISHGDKGCITNILVYCANISTADAVTCAYMLGSKDKYKDVALLLRSTIQHAFKESKPLPWPPRADDLEVASSNELLPLDLIKFLNYLLSGDADMDRCEKAKRIVLSIGQVRKLYILNSIVLFI